MTQASASFIEASLDKAALEGISAAAALPEVKLTAIATAAIAAAIFVAAAARPWQALENNRAGRFNAVMVG
ncbi:MAG: hypothetical protein ACFB5Z_01865 [Elainellaceae cyanobacterium]